MTGVVIGDAHLERAPRCPRRGEARDDFGDVADLRLSNAFARAAQAGSSFEQLAVSLHRRSASGCVDDDDIHVGAFEGGNQAAGECSRVLVTA